MHFRSGQVRVEAVVRSIIGLTANPMTNTASAPYASPYFVVAGVSFYVPTLLLLKKKEKA